MQQRLPEWFKQPQSKYQATKQLSSLLKSEIPNTICQEAKCPNRSDCWSKGVLTFMVLGTVCTRTCAFCSVKHGKPLAPDRTEINSILNAIEKLNLRFVVMTSPNRDDLKDGGASHYAYLIETIRQHHPEVKIEVLIPDFKGNVESLKVVIAAKPDVINHNMETVSRLYSTARKGSLYKRSLQLLTTIKEFDDTILTKTGVMVGLGETVEELTQTFEDINHTGVDIVTVGQYLKPDKESLDIARYYHPDEFDHLKTVAESLGIPFVFSGPLVRSSFLAEHVFDKTLLVARRLNSAREKAYVTPGA